MKLVWGAEERVVGFRPSHENSSKAYLISETKPNGGSYEAAGSSVLKRLV